MFQFTELEEGRDCLESCWPALLPLSCLLALPLLATSASHDLSVELTPADELRTAVMVVGALIFVLGIDLTIEAVWDTRNRVNRTEYITIWAIAIGMTV